VEFDFEAFKAKYSHKTDVEIFIGNAGEIRSLIAAYENKQKALEEMSKELAKANERIQDLKGNTLHTAVIDEFHVTKAPYDNPCD
jgi:predicted RNase H-like nuclease (RuvC/YqgF family)